MGSGTSQRPCFGLAGHGEHARNRALPAIAARDAGSALGHQRDHAGDLDAGAAPAPGLRHRRGHRRPGLLLQEAQGLGRAPSRPRPGPGPGHPSGRPRSARRERRAADRRGAALREDTGAPAQHHPARANERGATRPGRHGGRAPRARSQGRRDRALQRLDRRAPAVCLGAQPGGSRWRQGSGEGAVHLRGPGGKAPVCALPLRGGLPGRTTRHR